MKLMIDNFSNLFDYYSSLINNRLATIFTDCNLGYDNVIEAMNYSLNIGGKRIRPILTLAFCEMCGGEIKDALDVACAVECIHTYSLIHDDLPCMDNDDTRRGSPSCHVRFGESVALLAGDGLLTHAFSLIANAGIKEKYKVQAIKQLSLAAGYRGMIGGQAVDMATTGENLSRELLTHINSLKTGSLIKAASALGCIVAGGTQKQIDAAERYSQCIGLAYQIVDDILDDIGDPVILGKPTCSDQERGKHTYVDACGIEECKQEVERLSNTAVDILNNEFAHQSGFLINLTYLLLGREK